MICFWCLIDLICVLWVLFGLQFQAKLGDGTVQGEKLRAEFLKRANDWIFKNTSRAIDLFRRVRDTFLSH